MSRIVDHGSDHAILNAGTDHAPITQGRVSDEIAGQAITAPITLVVSPTDHAARPLLREGAAVAPPVWAPGGTMGHQKHERPDHGRTARTPPTGATTIMTDTADKAGKRLTVHNASVRTATVEIKTLTVSGKQVTLAVFRQLIEESILDRATAEITGNAWGSVNYHPGKCADNPEHLHVVWQKGTELRRATIQAPGAGFHHHPAADLYAQLLILRRAVHEPYSDPRPGDRLRMSERIHGGWRVFRNGRFTYRGMTFEGRIPERLHSAWKEFDRRPDAADWQAFDAAATRLGIQNAASRDNIEDELLSVLPTSQYQRSWTELAELPQLFIAV